MRRDARAMASSTRFAELQETVEANIASLKEAILVLPSSSKDGARQINSECTELQRSIDRDLRALETETKVSAPSLRRSQQDIIAQLRRDNLEANQKLQRINDTMHRAELLPSKSAEDTALLAARDKMVATTGAASRGTAKLLQANALLSETTDIGVNVLDTMQQQRGQIISATGKATGTNTLTQTAKNILQGMQRRAIGNKVLQIVAIVILLVLIAVIIYVGFIKDPKKK